MAERSPSSSPEDRSSRELLKGLFEAAVASAAPSVCLPGALPPPPPRRTVVLGAGKAAAAMAQVVEEGWLGEVEGLVVTPYGHGAPCSRVEVVEASHPVPDEAGLLAARRILDLARDLGPDDLALCLLSGGGSALWALPATVISLQDKRAVTQALLASGATIHEINTVRKHLSAIKGGRLAVACHPASVWTLALSDVPGDDPSAIASGPTVGDPTTRAEARQILSRYHLAVPPAVERYLDPGLDPGTDDGEAETPKPGDPRLEGARYRIVASASTALDAASRRARELGAEVKILGEALQGEAREVGREHGRIARQIRYESISSSTPWVLLSGGETTVTGSGGPGVGGRNTELLLALALELKGAEGIWALGADTDGLDGRGPGAGAWVTPDTLVRASALGLDAEAALRAHDAGSFFERLGDLLVTGPTRTNVNDFRALLIRPPAVA